MVTALWQVQESAANGTQVTAGAANTVFFNSKPVTATGGYMYRSEILLRNSSPENTSIGGGINDIEDMGTDGIDMQVTGEFRNKNADLTKLIKFWKEPKTTTGYTKGRFGLSIDEPDHFDVTPTSTYGYHIINPRIIIDYELKKVYGFVLTLRLGGDVPSAI